MTTPPRTAIGQAMVLPPYAEWLGCSIDWVEGDPHLVMPFGEHVMGWPGLLQHLIEQARASIEQGLSAIQALPDAEVRALLPLRVVAHIHLTQLQEIAGKGDRILHERVLLTPLRKWWISQRVRWGWLP